VSIVIFNAMKRFCKGVEKTWPTSQVTMWLCTKGCENVFQKKLTLVWLSATLVTFLSIGLPMRTKLSQTVI